MSPPRLRGSAAVIRDVGLVSAGRYSQYLVTLITLPLSARVLGPSGMGLLAIGMATYFLGALCTDLGMTAFVAARVSHPGLNTLRGDYAAVRVAGLSLFVVVFAAALVLDVPRAVEVGALGLVIGSVSACGDEWVLLGAQRFGTVVLQQASGRVVYLATLIALLPHLRTPEAALACLLAGTVVTVGWSWARTIRDYGRPAHPRDPRALVRVGLPVWLSRLLASTYGPSAATVLAVALPTKALGLFSAGDRAVQAAGSLVDAIGVTLLPRLASRRDDDFWPKTRRLIVVVAVVGICLAVVMTATAPWVVPLIFGGDFTGSVRLLQIESWALPGMAVTSFIATAALPVLGDARGVLLVACCGASVLAIALVATLYTRDPLTAVVGIVCAQTAAAAFSVFRVHQLRAEPT